MGNIDSSITISLDHLIGKRASERVSTTTAHGSRPCGDLQYAARRATD
jgi:hypothetical protein